MTPNAQAKAALPKSQRHNGLAATLMLALTAMALAPALAAAADAALPALKLSRDGVTVSGLSSGGYMAGQFQVAFSGLLSGAAVLAAGPYGCTRGQLSTAMRECSCPTDLAPWLTQFPGWTGIGCRVPSASELAVRADTALTLNRLYLDDPANLARQRVWLLQGSQDPVVAPPLVEAAANFYRQHGVAASAIKLRPVAGAGHGLPVPGGPVACKLTASPYLTDCPGVDAAGELLAWLYGAPGSASGTALGAAPAAPADASAGAPADASAGAAPTAGLAPGVAPRPAGLMAFDQRRYRQHGVFDGLDDSGWLYVPAACTAQSGGTSTCRLHVVFHGCAQGQGFAGPSGQPIGRTFVEGAGYNRWAESHHLVLLYPQVRASTPSPADQARGATYQLNPQGCWDFWGYTNRDEALTGVFRVYARRGAPQMAAVKRMVDALLRPAAAAAKPRVSAPPASASR